MSATTLEYSATPVFYHSGVPARQRPRMVYFESGPVEVVYSAEYEGNKFNNQATWAHLTSRVLDVKFTGKGAYWGSSVTTGTVKIGDTDYTYKCENCRHYFTKGDTEVYNHCSFKKGLRACFADASVEPTTENVTFSDFKVKVNKITTYSMNCSSSSGTKSKTTAEPEPEPEPEPDDDEVVMGDLFPGGDDDNAW